MPRNAGQLDADLLAPLTASQTAALRHALGELATHHDLPGGAASKRVTG